MNNHIIRLIYVLIFVNYYKICSTLRILINKSLSLLEANFSIIFHFEIVPLVINFYKDHLKTSERQESISYFLSFFLFSIQTPMEIINNFDS